MLVGWYLRRAIPWMTLLGCCATAVLLALAVNRWPATALVLLPALVASCAAAAAFCFDEAALPVVAVTPRGATWRRTARLAVSVVPYAVWAVVVVVRPGSLPLDRDKWLLVGLAAIVFAAGLAALASRRGATAPGTTLAGAVALVCIGPIVVSSFLGWKSLYPIEVFPSGTVAVWMGVAGAGMLACLAALRPGLRP